jgi:dimethylhistidine N-methyltransferase
LHPRQGDFLQDATSGLQAEPKRLSPMYFYDATGSKLFDRICELEEYYPTRTEVSILRRNQRAIGEAIGEDASLIELGSGSSLKTHLVLESVKGLHSYVPIDISKKHLLEAASRIQNDFESLRVLPVCADFMGELRLPAEASRASRKVFWFPGSTIGNLPESARHELLARLAKLCQPQGGLLVGIDLKKSSDVIERAYNDDKGVTAAFNLNVLERMNRELGADFNVDRFAHKAFYNDTEGRIEMHLESLEDQRVHLHDQVFEFSEGETLCTEYSYKFTVDGFASEASKCGLRLVNQWQDDRNLFAVLMLST